MLVGQSNLFIQFNQYLLSVNLVPGTILTLGTEQCANTNKTCCHRRRLLVEGMENELQANKKELYHKGTKKKNKVHTKERKVIQKQAECELLFK